jgi:hypothetical protein
MTRYFIQELFFRQLTVLHLQLPTDTLAHMTTAAVRPIYRLCHNKIESVHPPSPKAVFQSTSKNPPSLYSNHLINIDL